MPTIICMSVEKLAFAAEEKSHEAKILFGRGLWLVCHSSLFSAELAGGYLVGDPRQQLMLKQGRPRTAWSYIGQVLAALGHSVPLPHIIQEGLYLNVWHEDITAINIKLNQMETGWVLWERYDYKLLRM